MLELSQGYVSVAELQTLANYKGVCDHPNAAAMCVAIKHGCVLLSFFLVPGVAVPFDPSVFGSGSNLLPNLSTSQYHSSVVLTKCYTEAESYDIWMGILSQGFYKVLKSLEFFKKS